MAQVKQRITRTLATWAFFIGLGFAGGYYVRDQRVDEEIGDAVDDARDEMQRAASDAIERARQAAGDLAAGAEAAAESTKAAFSALTGGETKR